MIVRKKNRRRTRSRALAPLTATLIVGPQLDAVHLTLLHRPKLRAAKATNRKRDNSKPAIRKLMGKNVNLPRNRLLTPSKSPLVRRPIRQYDVKEKRHLRKFKVNVRTPNLTLYFAVPLVHALMHPLLVREKSLRSTAPSNMNFIKETPFVEVMALRPFRKAVWFPFMLLIIRKIVVNLPPNCKIWLTLDKLQVNTLTIMIRLLMLLRVSNLLIRESWAWTRRCVLPSLLLLSRKKFRNILAKTNTRRRYLKVRARVKPPRITRSVNVLIVTNLPTNILSKKS